MLRPLSLDQHRVHLAHLLRSINRSVSEVGRYVRRHYIAAGHPLAFSLLLEADIADAVGVSTAVVVVVVVVVVVIAYVGVVLHHANRNCCCSTALLCLVAVPCLSRRCDPQIVAPVRVYHVAKPVCSLHAPNRHISRLTTPDSSSSSGSSSSSSSSNNNNQHPSTSRI